MTQVMSDDFKVDEDNAIDPEELQSDPFKEIVDIQNASDKADIETMMKALSDNGAEEDTDPETETSPDAPESNATSPKGETGRRSSDEARRPGIDVVLKDIESQLSPEHAEVVRAIQTKAIESSVERKDAVVEMKELQLEVERLRQAINPEQPKVEPTPEPVEEVDPLLKNVPPQQLEVFKAMAKHLGYIQKEELDAEEQQAEMADYHTTIIDEGIEAFGEEFGTRNEAGQFSFSEELKPEVQSIYDRINDEARGLTAQDLYKLATYERLASGNGKAKEPAPEEDLTPAERSTARRPKAYSERGNAPVSTSRNFYRKGVDRLEDVVARASASGFREVS